MLRITGFGDLTDYNWWSVFFLVFVTLFIANTNSQITRNIEGLTYECGGFIDITDPSETGSIYTPSYPGSYPNLARCIWLFQTPKEYTLSFSLSGILGEGNLVNGCIDFLEVRNGTADAELMYYDCSNTAETTLTGYSRWFWVKFESDWTNPNTGFVANYSVVSDPGNSNDVNPVKNCYDYEYKCANKQCITWAYRCDGENDCGCSTKGCDEIDCGGLSLSEASKAAIGVGVGVAVFIIVFIGVGLLEICLKKRAETKYRQQVEEAERRAKKKKAQKMAQNFLMNAAEGAKLNVPSIDLNASMSSTGSSTKS